MKLPPEDRLRALEALPQVGDTIDGKYRVDGVLGFGGMGVVLAATHLRLDCAVAIKMLLPEWMNEPSIVQRFAREGRASAAIRSEHVARVLDVDESDGRPYIVFEHLRGEDLAAVIARDGAQTVATAVRLVLQACEALAEAHAMGTVHRDLKPANLFLTVGPDGAPCLKVLDFGISKVSWSASRAAGDGATTQPLLVMGSPAYMAPEQMRQAVDADSCSDVWSLGAILFELLAGAPPFAGQTITEVCAQVMLQAPPRLSALRGDVPPELEQVVLSCLEKDRDLRCPDVACLARQLAPFGGHGAHEAAERVARIRYGGIVPPSTPPLTVAQEPPISAMSRISGMDALSSGRRSRKGYVLAAVAFLAVIGDVGWQVASRTEVTRAVAAQHAESSLATLAPVANVLAATAPSPTPPVPSNGIPAAVPVAPAIAAPGAPPAVKVAIRPPVHRSPRRVAPPPRPHEPSPPSSAPALLDSTPALAHLIVSQPTPPIAEPPAPASTETAAPSPPSEADDLFEERK
jgi:serine/threonine-protein kinase